MALTTFPLAVSAEAKPVTCPMDLAPTSAEAPRLPGRLHNEYAGVAQVDLVVGVDGRVWDPLITSLQLRPVGHAGNRPEGYEAAVLSAVSRWRYPHQVAACRKRISITLDHAGD